METHGDTNVGRQAALSLLDQLADGAATRLPAVVAVERLDLKVGADLARFDVLVEYQGRRYWTRVLTRTERGRPAGRVTCYSTRPAGSTRRAAPRVTSVVEAEVVRGALDVPRAWLGAEWREPSSWEERRTLLPTEGDLRHDAHGRVDGALDPTVWRRCAPQRARVSRAA